MLSVRFDCSKLIDISAIFIRRIRFDNIFCWAFILLQRIRIVVLSYCKSILSLNQNENLRKVYYLHLQLLALTEWLMQPLMVNIIQFKTSGWPSSILQWSILDLFSLATLCMSLCLICKLGMFF